MTDSKQLEYTEFNWDTIAKNLTKILSIGTAIFDKEIFKRIKIVLSKQNDGYFDYSNAIVSVLKSNKAKLLVIHEWCVICNTGVPYECITCDKNINVSKAWLQDWARFINGFPLKKRVINTNRMKCYPFNNLWNIAYMRYKGNLSPSDYEECSNILSYEGNKKLFGIKLLILLPRWISTYIVYHARDNKLHRLISAYRILFSKDIKE